MNTDAPIPDRPAGPLPKGYVPDLVLGPGESILFTYGTMMRGNRNAARIAGARYLGTARTTTPRFSLYCVGYAPMAVRDISGHVLHGECYVLSAALLAKVDRAEGHPWKYRRERVSVVLECGSVVQAWAYLVNLAVLCEEPRRVPRPSGRWKQPAESSRMDRWRRVMREIKRRERGGSSDALLDRQYRLAFENDR